MTATTPGIVTSYLAQLETAMTDVAPDVRAEIVAGVREELVGLDDAEAAIRIEELGDPQFIAAEAREGVDAEPHRTEPQWLWVLAAILVMIGGVVVPFIGAITGLVLMWVSSAWTRRQKWVATLIPVVAPFLAAVILAIFAAWPDQPDAGGPINPLVPPAGVVVWSALAIAFPALVVDGIWLLLAARRNLAHTTPGSDDHGGR